MKIRTDLASWLTYLETLHPKSIDLGLERVKAVAEKLKLLPVSFFPITVGGTNGKGSCVSLLEKIFLTAGIQPVGVYTSPHLFKFNERFRINGVEPDESSLIAAFAEIEAARQDISLTYFEFSTLAALLLFKQADVKVALLEVGMGGRLDAVNIVDPELALISTIDLDHTEWLGPNRETIGFEKAGIMRSNKPVVCGDFNTPLSIRQHALEIGARLYCQNEDFHYEVDDKCWSFVNKWQHFCNLPLPKIAVQNAATVLQALQLLPSSFNISQSAMTQALQKVQVLGRFQIFSGPVQRIFDVAHNPAGAALLAKKLGETAITGHTLAVVGMLQDKDALGQVAKLHPYIHEWHVGGLNVPRGGTAQWLAEALRTVGAKTIVEYETVALAYRGALARAKEGDRVVTFGSFHTVAETMEKVELEAQN